ncbi:histidine phosphatase family protein [Bremerella cremea]|uniref:Histidine phosphatase family protein n=1 Tax=Bremerella cremea TaxID=1031537 RepID=A0A368KPM7_9BACT|nr:histidine phosphatase family protein [Bremerella cremea]RCS46440.1 histidine phosphatase family protein [Bremerella cremea]
MSLLETKKTSPTQQAPSLADLPPLKREIVTALWETVDQHPWILSATITGSFLNADGLEGISDIDFIVIVDRLDSDRFTQLQTHFRDALQPVLQLRGWNLRINPTLGPLKFNDPQTAVLHLMPYSREGHVEHVIQSPFTCFDWQLSSHYRRATMASVYPAYALQPRHFVTARRSISDYLKDYRERVVSYRELICHDVGYEEKKCLKPMTVRDQHEFAYHIIRFLMKNIVKLLDRSNQDLSRAELEARYFGFFPEDEAAIRELFAELAERKQQLHFDPPVVDLDQRIEAFVATFERQFRRIFQAEATRHVVFRHAETPLNTTSDGSIRFVGRSNPDILPLETAQLETLQTAIAELASPQFFSSPLVRCQQSLAAATSAAEIICDDRLQEIDYGACEGQTVQAARNQHPALFQAWQRGEDPPFPGGESTADVLKRASMAMQEIWGNHSCDTVTCTHNVVLRCLVGQAMGIPAEQWYRLRIPHLAPITFVQTREHGVFLDLSPEVERTIFQNFAQAANAS